MTRKQHDLIRSRHEQTQRRTGRSDTSGVAPASQRHDANQRVTGALSEGWSGSDLPFGMFPRRQPKSSARAMASG